MEKLQLLILFFIYNFIGVIIVISAGNFFFRLLGVKFQSILSYVELGFFGFIFIGFFSIFINFFTSINIYITSISSFLFIFLNAKDFKIEQYLKIFYISLLTTLLLFLANNNSPDAGLYHLPFIQILNENKIIVGASNIHFRFGLASIWQYIGAFYNNIMFLENGITMPIAILSALFFIFLIDKIYEELKNKSNFNIIKIIFLFFLFVSSLYSFSRYSNYGNDVPAHIYYFYLIYLLLYNNKFQNEFFLILISFICLFLFSNKLFFILVCFIPVYFLIKYKLFFFLKSKTFIILNIIFFLIILKNLLISGCLLYPVPFTCFEDLVWLNYQEVLNQSIEGEAWAKGWIDQKEIANFKTYSSNFNWVNSWLNIHFKTIIQKFSPIVLFSIFLIVIMNLGLKIKSFKADDQKVENFNLIFFLSALNLLFWFIKFPLYRYGYSFLLIFWICIFLKIIVIFNQKFNYTKLRSFIKYTCVVALILFTFKNLKRIKENFYYNYENYPWPNILTFDKNLKNPEVKKVFLQENFIYESDGLCMYYKAPCTNYKNKKINSYNYLSYKVYINTKNKKN